MMKTLQSVLYTGLCLVLVISTIIEARPPSNLSDNNQEFDIVEGPQLEDMRDIYYDVPPQSVYPSMSLEKLQMLYDLSRRAAYLRSPSLNGVDEIYRMPESKRQVRYRQCYFNPISCFKK